MTKLFNLSGEKEREMKRKVYKASVFFVPKLLDAHYIPVTREQAAEMIRSGREDKNMQPTRNPYGTRMYVFSTDDRIVGYLYITHRRKEQ